MVYLTCTVIGLGRRGMIKTWTEVAARVRLYMLTSDLTSLVPPQFSHWLQVRKVGTVIIIIIIIFIIIIILVEISLAQLRKVTEIAPKSLFLCVNRRAFRYGFSVGSKAIWFHGGGRPQKGEVT